jgi:hypothetical protein
MTKVTLESFDEAKYPGNGYKPGIVLRFSDNFNYMVKFENNSLGCMRHNLMELVRAIDKKIQSEIV